MFVIARYVKRTYATMPPVNCLQILEGFDSRDGFVAPLWRDADCESNIMQVHKNYQNLKVKLFYWKDSRNFGKQFKDAFVMGIEDAMNIENLNKEIKND